MCGYINIHNLDLNKLLNRHAIEVNNKEASDFLHTKKILITGGCGSIGSEIVKQLLYLGINNLCVIDNSECNMFILINEINKLFPSNIVKFKLRDINNIDRIRGIFEEYRPNIVFHAAAYKHVPIMESNPHESININIIGTQNIADFSIQYNVEKFLFISTDKAVNPTNIMGVCKRTSELYIHYLNTKKKTKFVITRFGNVLGSSGSVIPTFITNINENRNLQITHKDIIRYFMTIREASQLVIKAITIGKGGQILLFDMGEPVKIIDLAKNLLNMVSNYTIQIEFTGLRPGEKLYEELLCKQEEIEPTTEDKIMILKHPISSDNFIDIYNELINNYTTMNIAELKEIFKRIVREYINE